MSSPFLPLSSSLSPLFYFLYHVHDILYFAIMRNIPSTAVMSCVSMILRYDGYITVNITMLINLLS